MKRITAFPAVIGLAAVGGALILSGCGSDAGETSATDTTMVDSHEGHDHAPGEHGAPAPVPATPEAAKLGSEAMAGPFTVTLTTAKEPEIGDAQFTAVVMRNGQPVEDANVKIDLSMPTMDMGGPSAELKHTGGGKYAGTANLGMGGYFQAIVTVKTGGDSGSAMYGFDAMQPAT